MATIIVIVYLRSSCDYHVSRGYIDQCPRCRKSYCSGQKNVFSFKQLPKYTIVQAIHHCTRDEYENYLNSILCSLINHLPPPSLLPKTTPSGLSKRSRPLQLEWPHTKIRVVSCLMDFPYGRGEQQEGQAGGRRWPQGRKSSWDQIYSLIVMEFGPRQKWATLVWRAMHELDVADKIVEKLRLSSKPSMRVLCA